MPQAAVAESPQAVNAFTPAQRELIEDVGSHLLVLAPAGTGKTNALSHRIAHLLERGLAAPEEILCLTFTNRACKEMAQRAAAVVGEAAGRVVVRTIHGFCYDVLRQYGPLAGEDGREMSVCDEEDALEVIGEVLARLGARPGGEALPGEGEGGRPRGAQGVANFFELCKHQMYRLKTASCRRSVQAVFAQEAGKVRALCQTPQGKLDEPLFALLQRHGDWLLRAYCLRLLQDHSYDFTDLLVRAGRLLENEAVAAALRRRFCYVHIDEVQDISDIEYDLITRMARDAIFVLLGDMHQTIYGWRGSVPDVILPQFCERYGARTLHFSQNFRSTPGLCNLAQRFAHRAFGGEGAPPARTYTGEEVACAALEDGAAQAAWLYEQVKGLDLNGDFSRAAVLCRSNAVCQEIADGFAAYQRQTQDYSVRFMLSGEFKLFRRREIKDILAFFRCVLGESSTALKRIVSGYSKGIGPKTVADIERENREGLGVTLADFASGLTHRYGDYFGLLGQALETGQVVVFDVESTGVDVYHECIVQMAAIRVGPGARVLRRFEAFLRPAKPVGESWRVHGFSDEFLRAQGREPAEVLGEFLQFCDGAVVVGHNVGYDMGILHAELLRRAMPQPRVLGVYDTLDIARRYLPAAENHKLETLARLLHTQHQPSHDAMDDIEATAQVLVVLYRRFIAPAEAARKAFYKKHLEKFRKVRAGLEVLRREAAAMPLPAFAAHIAADYGVRAKYKRDPQRIDNIEAFLRFLEDGMFARENHRENLYAALEYAALSSSELDRLSKDARQLPILTVHQAKGCEFEYVFLPSLMEYTFPGYISVRHNDVGEEKRVFYVAITRAKKRLYLSWYRNKNGRETEKSRFLGML